MKRGSKLLISILLIVCLCVIPTFSECFAAEPYTYTITVLSGDKGSFGGQDSLTFSGLSYGSVIDLSGAVSAVTLSSDKYYVKGLRQSGHDNSELSSPAVSVTEDAIFVIAYGIKGDMVNYTVNFQDAAGNTLAASVNGVGKIGDKPVVAYKYIDGYSPNAYNLAKTLSADESSNVFTFVYTKAATGTTTTVVTNTTANNNNANNNAANANETGNNGQNATGVGDLEEPVVQAEVTEGGSSNEAEAPADMIDLDEPEVALVDAPGGSETDEPASSKLSFPLIIAAVVFVILVALLIAYLKKKKALDGQDINETKGL